VTESEYIAELKAEWPKGRAAPRGVLSLACLAVQEFPNSAMLWFLRGQLMWMSPEDYMFSKLDAITSFEKALELDPSFSDARNQLEDCRDRTKDQAEKFGGEKTSDGNP
jgi:hypothetical protein